MQIRHREVGADGKNRASPPLLFTPDLDLGHRHPFVDEGTTTGAMEEGAAAVGVDVAGAAARHGVGVAPGGEEGCALAS